MPEISYIGGQIAAGVAAGSIDNTALASGAVSLSKTGTDIWTKGADVASANNLVLGADGDLFHITGTTQINLMASTNFRAGSHVRLIFDGAVTVKHGQTASGANKKIVLAGAADILTVANDVMEFVYDGTSWFEVGNDLPLNGGTMRGSLVALDIQLVQTAPAISSGTLTLALATANVFSVALNANITTMTVTGIPASGKMASFQLILTADGTARTITFMSGIVWPGGAAPTPTSTNGKRDIFQFETFDGGTTWFGLVVGQNF